MLPYKNIDYFDFILLFLIYPKSKYVNFRFTKNKHYIRFTLHIKKAPKMCNVFCVHNLA